MPQSPRTGRDGDVLAVVIQSRPAVPFFDSVSDRHIGTVQTPAEPHELCFDPAERLLWCTVTYRSGFYHANKGRCTELVVIDPDTCRVVEVVDLAPEHAPHGLAPDPARRRLYVSVEGSGDRPGGVVVIDTQTRRPVGRIDTDAPGSHWVAVDAAGRTGCVANKEAPFVSVLDLERLTLTAKAEVPGSEGVAVSADGARAYVATPYNGAYAASEGRPAPGIKVVDTRTASVVDTLATRHRVMPVHLTSTGVPLAGEVEVEPESSPGDVRMAPGRLAVFSTDASEGRRGRRRTRRRRPHRRSGRLERLARLDRPEFGATGAHGLRYVPRPD